MSGKGIGIILGVKIVDNRSDALSATCKTHTAFIVISGNKKFVVGIRNKSSNRIFCTCYRSCRQKIIFPSHTVKNAVVGIADIQPFKMDCIVLGNNAANINISDIR